MSLRDWPKHILRQNPQGSLGVISSGPVFCTMAPMSGMDVMKEMAMKEIKIKAKPATTVKVSSHCVEEADPGDMRMPFSATFAEPCICGNPTERVTPLHAT